MILHLGCQSVFLPSATLVGGHELGVVVEPTHHPLGAKGVLTTEVCGGQWPVGRGARTLGLGWADACSSMCML